jgi:hypothetical protein
MTKPPRDALPAAARLMRFANLDAYRRFVDEVVGRRNARRRKLIEIERTAR